MSAIPRNEGEAFEDYKARRAADHAATQKAMRGKLFHDSYYDGTYYNPERASRKAGQLHSTPYSKASQITHYTA